MTKQNKIKLNSGDVFSIKLDNNEFAFGRALKKVDIGFVIEIFDFFSNSNNDYDKAVNKSRLFHPQPLDSHSIFWLRNEGEWNLLGHTNDFFVEEDIYFVYGPKGEQKLIDINGNEKPISDEESKKYFRYSPKGDIEIKRLIKFWRDKKANGNGTD